MSGTARLDALMRSLRTRRVPAASGEATGFCAAVIFIAAVSVHDALLVAVNAEVIADVELNPLGRGLLALCGDVWLLIAAKLMGTSVACAALVALYHQWRPASLAAAGAISCFQFVLLLYLSLG
jgi:hypothetical protein